MQTWQSLQLLPWWTCLEPSRTKYPYMEVSSNFPSTASCICIIIVTDHCWVFLVKLLGNNLLQTSRIPSVVSVELLIPFRARQHHMARVDDHHVISRVHWGQVNEEEEGRENRRNVKRKKKKRNYYEAGSKDEKNG